jgi:hypothetical protein
VSSSTATSRAITGTGLPNADAMMITARRTGLAELLDWQGRTDLPAHTPTL